jgi:hypothetical protein
MDDVLETPSTVLAPALDRGKDEEERSSGDEDDVLDWTSLL